MSGCTYTSIVMWSGFLDTPCNQDLLNTKQLMDTYAGIKDGSRLSIEQTCDLLRLSLRAFLDCSFVNLTHEIELKVGYEYYLHLNCRGIDYRDIENVVSQNGLYLNPRGGISSSKVKYDELSEFLKQAGTNCRFDPDTFYISDGQHSYYTILVFSEIIAWNISRRMRAALVVELSENYDYDITSMEDLYMIPNKPFILIYEEGRKATLGHEKVYIEDNPFEWKTYKVRDGHVYAVYQ